MKFINEKEFMKETENQKNGRKFFALLFFFSEYELGIGHSSKYKLTKIQYFTDPKLALDAYVNSCCSASQLVDGITYEELDDNVCKMIVNMNDEEWKREYLYPYL